MKQGTPYTPSEMSMRTRTGTAWLALHAGALIDEINDPEQVYTWSLHDDHGRAVDFASLLAATCLSYGIKPVMDRIVIESVPLQGSEYYGLKPELITCADLMWEWQGDSLIEGWDQI